MALSMAHINYKNGPWHASVHYAFIKISFDYILFGNLTFHSAAIARTILIYLEQLTISQMNV